MASTSRISKTFLVALTVIGLAGGTNAAENTTKPHLTVLVGDGAPPKMFAKDGKPSGYLVEIASEAAHRAGYEVDIQQAPWARALEMAKNGDGILPLSYSDERAKIFTFSQSIYGDEILLVTNSERDFLYSGVKDLAGHTIGINRGSNYGVEFSALRTSLNLEEDNGTEMRLRKLQASHIDGAIVSGGRPAVRFALKAIGADPKAFVVHMPPIAIDKNYFGIATSRPDAKEIISRLDSAVASMSADGTIAKIIATYD